MCNFNTIAMCKRFKLKRRGCKNWLKADYVVLKRPGPLTCTWPIIDANNLWINWSYPTKFQLSLPGRSCFPSTRALPRFTVDTISTPPTQSASVSTVSACFIATEHLGLLLLVLINGDNYANYIDYTSALSVWGCLRAGPGFQSFYLSLYF